MKKKSKKKYESPISVETETVTVASDDVKVVGNKNEPSTGNVVELFKAKCNTALSQINNLESFRKSDYMVDFVFLLGKSLFDSPLDTQSISRLMNAGGKLVGAYPYLGQKSSYARAERDVYEAKLSEVEKELFLQYVTEKYKVTEIKARISNETEIIKEFVIQKEVAKNQWESITEACQAMFSFCQSALRIKQSELSASSNLQNQG